MDALMAIVEEHGVFLTREALALGYSDRFLTRIVRDRTWHRVRRGAYVPMMTWRAGDEVGRHLIRAAAIHRSYGDRVAFNGPTAALMHGLPLWNVDLRRVHVARLDDGGSRLERDIVHHREMTVPDSEIARVDGKLVTSPALAAYETGLRSSAESAQVVFDALLHSKKASGLDLLNLHDVVQVWPWAQHLQIPLRMMDGRAESVGESRTRWLFWTQGVPLPELQHKVYDEHGVLFAISDFWWERERAFGEFDGKQKYLRLLQPGETPSDAVVREKTREDTMRRLRRAAGMLRYVWSELSIPVTTGRRTRAYLAGEISAA